MIHSPMDAHQVVTAAVALDGRSQPLVGIAADLCRRTGKKLHLLHAVEPWGVPFLGAPGLAEAAEAVEGHAKAAAERHLAELAGGVEGVAVTTTVVVGKPAERIGKEAESAGSCLLLIGADARQRRFMPRGFSTALSLMVTAPVPVFCVDVAATPRLPDDALAILLADDLSPQSEAAVSFAFDLASAFGDATLHHLHVNGMTLEGLRSGLEVAAATARTAVNPARTAADVFDALVRKMREELGARAASYRDYLEEAGGAYQAEVRTGQVRAELQAFVDANEPDVLVFGRHRSVHTRPFFLGRMPLEAMLAFARPVIVVPYG